MYVCMYRCMYVKMYRCINTYIHMYIRMRTYIHIYIHVHIHVYIQMHSYCGSGFSKQVIVSIIDELLYLSADLGHRRVLGFFEGESCFYTPKEYIGANS